MYKKCYQGKKLGDNYFEMHLWEEDGGHQIVLLLLGGINKKIIGLFLF